MKISPFVLGFVALVSVAVSAVALPPGGDQIDVSSFHRTLDGRAVTLVKLRNGRGLELWATNYGARVVALWAPDREGNLADVVTGFRTLDEYRTPGGAFHGPVVGRYGNRIAKGQFSLDGLTWDVGRNNGENHLHGGARGFHTVVWDVSQPDERTVRFHHRSPHLDQGYPGELDVTLVYQLTDDNAFKLTYAATSDRGTVVNLTHHTFFNLAGGGTINDHILQIDADFYTPTDAGLIPTGEIASVTGTPLDFRQPTAIGARVDTAFVALKNGGGYDHNWVLRRRTRDGVEKAATLFDPKSGRVMEIHTDQPGLQFYGGNFFSGKDVGKYGAVVGHREALALETQKFPDSPNHFHFPSTELRPGEVYRHTCLYRFSTR